MFLPGTPLIFAEGVAAEWQSSGIDLATHSNLGPRLRVPGVMEEGWFITGAKTVFKISSLGDCAHQSSKPFLTTEGRWGESDIDYLVRAQVLAVRVAAKQLVSGALSEWVAGAKPVRAPVVEFAEPTARY